MGETVKLRTRLLVMIGAASLLLWSGAALWMLRDLDHGLQRTLDDRLAMSARMVAGLVAQQSVGVGAVRAGAGRSLVVPGERGMACQIRSLRGEIVATTRLPGQPPLQSPSSGYRDVVAGGERWRTYTLRADGFDITTADRIDERGLLRRRIAMAAGVPFVIAAIGGLLALWVGVGQALAPLQALQAQLTGRRPDEVAPVASGNLPGELRPLIASLNGLLAKMASAMQREREFTNGAAHELRTPLTAIDTHLQVARLTGGATAARALEDAALGVDRMRATLDQLLMLARIEGQVSFDDGERISGDEAVARAVAAAGASAGSRLRILGGPARSALEVPAELAVVALRNLVDNALKYSAPDQAVEVEAEEGDGCTSFQVRDLGVGMTEEQLGLATRRFWRGTSAAPGVGLGLAMVRAVAEGFGGSLGLAAGPEGGVVATLRLPRARAGGATGEAAG